MNSATETSTTTDISSGLEVSASEKLSSGVLTQITKEKEGMTGHVTSADTDKTSATSASIKTASTTPTITTVRIKTIMGHTEDGIHCYGCKERFDECDVDEINHHVCFEPLPSGEKWEIQRPPKPNVVEEPPKKRRRGLAKKDMFRKWWHCNECGMDLECEDDMIDKRFHCRDCFFQCKDCRGYFETPHHMVDNSRKLCRECYEIDFENETPSTKRADNYQEE